MMDDIYQSDCVYNNEFIDLQTTKLQDMTELCSFIFMSGGKVGKSQVPDRLRYLLIPQSKNPWVFTNHSGSITLRKEWREVLSAMKSGYERFLTVRFKKTIMEDGGKGWTAFFFSSLLSKKYAEMEGTAVTKSKAYEQLMIHYRAVTPKEVRNRYAIISTFKRKGATKWVE